MNEQLKHKIDLSIRLLRSAGEAAKAAGQPLEIAYSGGKDSEVLLELAAMSGVHHKPIYKNTTIDPPGTITHVLSKGAEVIQPKMTFGQMMAKKGFPSRRCRFCCEVLKEYKVLDFAAIGVRREESKRRSERYQEPEVCRVFHNKQKCRHYYPLLNWTLDDVVDFLCDKNIVCHPLYYREDGTFDPSVRLGCMCCPLASKKKRLAEFVKWPNMVKLYCSSGQTYRENHPNSPNIKMFPTVYDWFIFSVFYDNYEQYKKQFCGSVFGINNLDAKFYLEQYFNIKF